MCSCALSWRQNLDEEKQAKRQLMDRIISYMKKRKLPTYFQVPK